MSIDAAIVHRVPGRVRLRLPLMRGDAAFFERLQVEMSTALPQTVVRANAASASVLVTGPEPIIARLDQIGREREWFDLSGDGTGATVSAVRLPFGRERRPLVMALLLMLAFVQVLRGRILVPATTLLWYAYAIDSGFFVLDSEE